MTYDRSIINRMKRIEGQVRGVIKMMEDKKDCRDVVTQMSAAKRALDRTAAIVVSENLEKCIREEGNNGENAETLIREAVDLLVKSR